MSWWEDQIGNGAEIAKSPLVVAMILSFLTALIRRLKALLMRPSLVAAIGSLLEAASCSMLSLMLTEAGILWLNLPDHWALVAGVFCGWIGTDGMTKLIRRGLVKFFGPEPEKQEPKK